MPGCRWPIDRSCLPEAVGDIDVQQQQDAEDLAVQVLWSLSGRQFGVCPVIARPCPQACGTAGPYATYYGLYGAAMGAPFMPVWDGSNWRNITCGCTGTCSWAAPSVIHLGKNLGLPVQSIEEIVIGGDVLDDAEYTLEGDLLYRIGGDWPSQDLSKPLDQPGTWSVTYLRGTPPPAGTSKLVALLAKEFLNACTGGKCKIPRRVKTITRQGVTTEMADPSEILAAGRTGIPEIDSWLAAVNPRALQSAPTVR